MKFKVGDKIRGISDNFKITNKAMTLAEVMSVEPLGIRVKILEHTNKSQIGKICLAITLEEHLAHFELVEEKEMNKLEELENKINELASEIEKLKAEEESKEWKPKHGDYYWFVDNDGVIHKTEWNTFGIHRQRYLIGNIFRTQEEAEFRAEQIKVEAELRRFSRPFEVSQCGNMYFPSREIAQKAIDTVGAERIKKYYFGVEE